MFADPHSIPLWFKLLYTLFLVVLVPVYWSRYGSGNFLWFSDVALFTLGLALWLNNRLLASMAAVSITLPEVLWTVEFLVRLLAPVPLPGLADYMFDQSVSLFVRGLSLFHVFLPVLAWWLVACLGYDPRAWWAQTLLGWLVLLLTYCLTNPSHNINWVFGPGRYPQSWLSPGAYFVLVLLFVPLFIYWPTHLILLKVFAPPAN